VILRKTRMQLDAKDEVIAGLLVLSAGACGSQRPHAVSSWQVISWSKGARMFEGLFQPMHLLVIFGIAFLVFGPKKLPELGKGIGEGIRGFKSALTDQQKPVATSTNVVEDQSWPGGWLMGFGTEQQLLLALGFVVLGPKRMQATLRHVA
jgi:sec-independent protein translocase protein TatA